MTLRSDLIEAMAATLRRKTGIQIYDYETIATFDELAEATLDAAIAYLTEHADEWKEQADYHSGPPWISNRNLGALLEVLSAPINPEGGEQ